MKVTMSPRNETISAKFTKAEVQIIERAAKADGSTVSDYVRMGALTLAVLDGNIDAARLLASKLGLALVDRVRSVWQDERQRLLA